MCYCALFCAGQLSWVFIHFGGPGEDTHLVSEFSHSWEHNWFIHEVTWGEISMRSGGEKGNHANKEFSLTWLILAQKHSKKVRMCWSRCIVSSFFRNMLGKKCNKYHLSAPLFKKLQIGGVSKHHRQWHVSPASQQLAGKTILMKVLRINRSHNVSLRI